VGVSVFMVYILTVALMDPTITFKMATRFVTRRSPLLLFLSTMELSIFFIVVSAHSAH
jgi:hypothetical protein